MQAEIKTLLEENLDILFIENEELKAKRHPFKDDPNFRELGGYPTKDGHKVKQGVFYRCGALGYIKDEEDIQRLKSYGIRSVLDFRSVFEAHELEDHILENCTNYRVSAMYYEDGEEVDFSPEGMRRLISEGEKNPDRDLFEILYGLMPFGNPAYKKLFEILLKHETPLLFHCTAGKDRTGICAMLILLALGVDEATIIDDYLYTNVCREKIIEKVYLRHEDKIKEDIRLLPHLVGYTGVSRRHILAAINSIKNKYKDYETFFENEYGLSKHDLNKLREWYLD